MAVGLKQQAEREREGCCPSRPPRLFAYPLRPPRLPAWLPESPLGLPQKTPTFAHPHVCLAVWGGRRQGLESVTSLPAPSLTLGPPSQAGRESWWMLSQKSLCPLCFSFLGDSARSLSGPG